MPTYKIVRVYFNDPESNETIDTGLSLEDAQAHCNDPETSSRTATGKAERALTEKCGPWFDAYYEEQGK